MEKRIEFLDLAKGIGIFLVLFIHATNACGNLEWGFRNAIEICYMPLFFFISGLFFKTYNGYFLFLKKKINTLLMPFLFFHISGCLLLPFLNSYSFEVHHLYDFIFADGLIPNGPCWFVLCLFIQIQIFYFLVYLSNKFRYPIACVAILSFFCGGIGYYINDIFNFSIGLCVGTAFTAIPFLSVGFILRNKTNIITRKYNSFMLLAYALISFFVTYIFAEPTQYYINRYNTSFLNLYFCGFMGLSAIISFSIVINQFPFISFLGKNSLIILLSHNPYMQRVMPLLFRINFHNWWMLSLIATLIVGLSYYALVPLFVRVIPYFCGRKELFHTQT